MEVGEIIEVKHTVDVGRTTSVVTREDGLELRNAVLVALLETTEESLVEVALIVRVAVSTGDNTGVDTLLNFVSICYCFLIEGARTVALQCQMSMKISGTGSQVLESTSWMSMKRGIPSWFSETSERIISPVTSATG